MKYRLHDGCSRHDEGILVIRPGGSLEAADFQSISQQIDPYIEANGNLHGVLIDAKSFPGWKDRAALDLTPIYAPV